MDLAHPPAAAKTTAPVRKTTSFLPQVLGSIGYQAGQGFEIFKRTVLVKADRKLHLEFRKLGNATGKTPDLAANGRMVKAPGQGGFNL